MKTFLYLFSYFTRLPTEEEKAVCCWITFTSDADWKPYDDHFKDVETAMINHHVYPDPIHPHYDMEGNRLDGRTFKTLNTIAAS
jgi:hypothetical protein